MWAQLISAHLKPGKERELAELFDQLKATEQPGEGDNGRRIRRGT
jgi:hypothetical protein